MAQNTIDAVERPDDPQRRRAQKRDAPAERVEHERRRERDREVHREADRRHAGAAVDRARPQSAEATPRSTSAGVRPACLQA